MGVGGGTDSALSAHISVYSSPRVCVAKSGSIYPAGKHERHSPRPEVKPKYASFTKSSSSFSHRKMKRFPGMGSLGEESLRAQHLGST